MNGWPKQFITVWGVQIATEDFVKNREDILARLAKERVQQEPWQMMNKSKVEFEKILKWVEENDVETPVVVVSVEASNDAETVEPIQVQPEEEIVPEKQELKKTVAKKKANWNKK